MRILGISLLGATMAIGTQAMALDETGATRLGCFREVQVAAQYRVEKTKIKDSYQQYVKRTNGRIDLLEFPATYREDRYLVKPAHTVMQQVKCPD